MRLLKSDVTRFFMLGFGAGALLIAATVGLGSSHQGVVSSAVAAPAAE